MSAKKLRQNLHDTVLRIQSLLIVYLANFREAVFSIVGTVLFFGCLWKVQGLTYDRYSMSVESDAQVTVRLLPSKRQQREIRIPAHSLSLKIFKRTVALSIDEI